MADIGELVVRIKADAAQLEREMKKANGVVQQNAGQMTKAFSNLKAQVVGLAPALSVAALVAFGKSALTQADHINDLALRTGFLGSTLSALNIPLKQSGSSLDEFTSSMVRMNNAIGEATVNGGSPLLKTFNDLELSVKKLNQLSPEQQFFEIAKALNEVKSQSEFTRLGIDIFGRSFATIAPLIRDANGEIEKMVGHIKDAGNALTEEELKRIDEWGDKWTSAVEHAKLGIVDFLNELGKITEWVNSQPDPSGKLLLARVGIPPTNEMMGPNLPRGSVSHKFPGTIVSHDPFGPNAQSTSAKGTNPIKEATDATKQLSAAQAEAKRIIEETRTPQENYNASLAHAKELLSKHLIDQETYNRYLAEQADILNTQVSKSLENVQDQSILSATIIKDYMGDAFESAIFDAKNFGDAAGSILDGIARKIARQAFIDPLSNSLSGMISSNLPSLTSFMPHFATGGNPPVGMPSVVGERGPEIFIPKTAGTIIPNGAMGGSSVSVQNVFNISDGVTRQEMAQLIPMIEARTKAGVFEALERGGRESRAVGRKA